MRLYLSHLSRHKEVKLQNILQSFCLSFSTADAFDLRCVYSIKQLINESQSRQLLCDLSFFFFFFRTRKDSWEGKRKKKCAVQCGINYAARYFGDFWHFVFKWKINILYSGPKSVALQNIKANVMCIQASCHFSIFAQCLLITWCFEDFL